MEVKRDDPMVPSSLRSMNLWIQITAIKKQLCEKVSSATAAGTMRVLLEDFFRNETMEQLSFQGTGITPGEQNICLFGGGKEVGAMSPE